jgi:chromate transporter
MRQHPLGRPLCLAVGIATVVLVGGLRWPLAWVVLGLGTLSVALVWRRLKP